VPRQRGALFVYLFKRRKKLFWETNLFFHVWHSDPYDWIRFKTKKTNKAANSKFQIPNLKQYLNSNFQTPMSRIVWAVEKTCMGNESHCLRSIFRQARLESFRAKKCKQSGQLRLK
jgi:hypothetical protein